MHSHCAYFFDCDGHAATLPRTFVSVFIGVVYLTSEMQALGALRWTAPKSYPRSFSMHRQLSTSLRSPNLILRTNSGQILPCILTIQRRHLSLGSIFSRSKPTPTPSALTVATIARVETDANVSPHDVSKQLALFQALVDTNVKPGYDIVIARWERMCEFVRFCAL